MAIFKVLLLALLLAVAALGGLYAFSPPTFVSVAVGAERAASGLQRKEIAIPGFRIAYLDSGGSGAPLVLVHGFGADKDNWVRVARHLRHDFRIIAPDLPGYGESDAPLDQSYRIADQVQRLHAFVQALGLTHVHLGGSSMGGNIVAHYAIAHPNEVGSLWLVANAGVGGAPQSELWQIVSGKGDNPLIPSTRQGYRAMVDFVMSRPPVLPGRVLDVLADRAIAARPLRLQQFDAILAENATLESRIAGLPVPTHLLWGARDRALHVGAVDVLKPLLPRASATVMPDIGHLPMIEDPEGAARDYLAFRATLR